jgi:cobalt-zinc-cadmium efflux system outer membrane protein
MKKLYYRLSGLCVMLLCTSATLYAQDTVRLTLPEAENLFIKKNISLLAEKYNISIAEAQTIQAKLYPNPNFSFTGNIYNPEQRKAVDITNRTGEYIFNAQQLILLAGKRNKQIKVAQTGVLLAENAFYDLLRTLQYSLRSDFYKAFYLYKSIAAYQLQLQSVEKLSNSFEQLQEKGTVTLKDAVRIKSLLYSLKTEQALLKNQFNDVEAELQQLLQDNNRVYIPVAEEDLSSLVNINQLTLQSLIDTAFNNRADLKLTNNTVLLSQQNLAYQKALATPDITLGVQFDKRGSFVENASFFTAAIDLPFFNRNQGNIKAAQFNIEQSKLLASKQKLQVENEVQHAYVNALNTYKALNSIAPNFTRQFEQLLKEVTLNFEKQNISLLDFTDFYDSYKQNILQLNQVQNEYRQALENLNFTCGKIVTGN